MLNLKNRVTKKKDFDFIFKKGRGLKEGFLVVRYAPNNLSSARFGFIVSQKVSKKAVVRNKIKRQLSEIVQKNLGIIKKKVDCVLIVLPGFSELSFKQKETLLQKIFKKLNLT